MNEQTLRNFRAFTKIYGYIRFFHPSDEASSIDWDKFAVYGFEKVENAGDDNELKTLLLELFLPIAPAIEIYFNGENFTYDQSKIIPADTTGLLPVAWQHYGIATDTKEFYNIYSSKRLNRLKINQNKHGQISKVISAERFSGKRIRVSAGVKLNFGENASGELFVRSSGKEISVKFNNDKWEECSVEIEVQTDTDTIEIGCRLYDEGAVYLNGFRIYVYENDCWMEFEVKGLLFEDQLIGNEPVGWIFEEVGYIFKILDFEKYHNDRFCIIEGKYEKQPFEKYPAPGEIAVKLLNDNLKCVFPLCLYTDENGTLPRSSKKFNDLSSIRSDEKFKEPDSDSGYTRLAVSAVIWNVIQHSYPYFEYCDIDWDRSLNELLINADIKQSKNNFINGVYKATAKLDDGHLNMSHPDLAFKFFYPPFILDHAEGKFVISRILEENTGVKTGDIILEIDGIDINKTAEEEMKNFSASTHGRKMHFILSGKLIRHENSNPIKLKILRDEKTMQLSVERKYKMNDFFERGLFPEYRKEKYIEFKPGIFYADLTRFEPNELEDKLSELINAEGVIFDLRGYPFFDSDFLKHLTDETIRFPQLLVPQIIYPDRENMNDWDGSGRGEWEPMKPRFRGKIIFMTNYSAISWAETIMSIVEAYKLGTIIGSQTAGTNGDCNRVKLTGGYTFQFTGTKVLKHDDTPHHGVGIHPTVPVSRTVKGIREKRDEFLEKAIEVIENAG